MALARRRKSILAGLAVASLLALWLLRGEREIDSPGVAADPWATPARPLIAAAPAGAAEEAAQEHPDLLDDLSRDMIEAVTIDKSTVCAHEPFTITATAHNADGRSDVELMTVAMTPFGVVTGNPIVTRLPRIGKHSILVKVTNFASHHDERSVAVNVKDCGDRYERLEIDAKALAPTVYHFVVNPMVESGHDANVIAYQWDFGDGTQVETTEPYAEHDYFDWPQEVWESVATVEVRARNARGVLEGKTSLVFRSAYAHNKLAGVLSPLVRQEQPDGNTVALRVTNLEDEPLSLTDVEARVWPCEMKEATTARIVSAAPTTILGTAVLPPGEWKGEARVPQSWLGNGENCQVQFHVMGVGPGGYAVDLSFGVIVGSRAPLASIGGGQPLSQADQEQLQLVRQAAGVLRTTIVKQSDLDRLLREGKIKPAGGP